jgi:hypothetical protein
MSELIRDRGQWSLQEMNISVLDNDEEVTFSIIELNQGFMLAYDVENTTVDGQINIIDRYDVVKKYKISGGQTISIKLSAGDDKPVKLNLLVYKVTPSVESSSDARRYSFSVTSVDHTNFNRSHSISLEGTIDSQIDKFLKNAIQTQSKFEAIHPPKWPMKFVFNAEKGYSIIEFLETRCLSEKNNSVFRFFETFDGYKLVSLKEAYDDKPIKTFVGQIESETNTLSYLVYDNFKLISQGDHNEMMENGGYGSLMSTFDVFNKKHIPNKESKDKTPVADKAYTTEVSKLFRLSYNDPTSTMKQDHVEDITPIRLKQEATINNTVISIRVPGMSDNIPGLCVGVTVYGVIRNISGGKNKENSLSGKYVITRVDNVFGEQWLQTLTLKRF